MRFRTRAIAAAAAGVLTLALVAGCGADSDDDAKSTTTEANGTTTEANGTTKTTTKTTEPSSSGEDNGVADLEADEILDKATTALREAGSVQVTGEISQDGGKLGIDLGISRDGAAGNMSIDGAEVNLIVTKEKVYMQGDAAFYESIGGGAAAKLLGDKWLSVDADAEQARDFGAFGDFDEFVDSFLDPGDIKKGDTGDIEGTPAIALDDQDDEEPSQLWVATVGEPYPLQVNRIGSDTEKIRLSKHGEEVDTTPPPSDEVVDLADLERMGDSDSSSGN